MPLCCCYPQFTVTQHDGQPKRCSMHNAARILADEGGSLADNVLESDGSTRPISEPEQQQIMSMSKDWVQAS